MKITPVFNDLNAIPVWNIEDIEIPDSIQDACQQKDAWLAYTRHKNGRYVHKEEYWLSNSLEKIGYSLIHFLKNQQDYNFDSYYSVTKFQSKLENSKFGFNIVKDNPGFKQDPHLDSRFVMCSTIINLVDNDEGAGTYYYDYFDYYTKDKQTLIYKSPTKKGTGTLHVNTCVNLHEGWNNTESNRFIAFGNIEV